MRKVSRHLALVAMSVLLIGNAWAVTSTSDDASRPIKPGRHLSQPFWNHFALRFIYPPSFDFPEVEGANSYRFAVVGADGDTRAFSAERPDASLAPIWANLPEGVTNVSVQAVGEDGKPTGEPQEREFYRSPGFCAAGEVPLLPYGNAVREGLQAIFRAPHVQHWLDGGTPDKSYVKYCYPNKVMGALARAMAAYATSANDETDRKAAKQIAVAVADHLLALRYPAHAKYGNVPPTYSLDVDKPTKLVRKRVDERWLMTPSAFDAAFGFLDVYDLTEDERYLAAAKEIAVTFSRSQDADGTWPLMADWKTGAPIAPQRLIPTWAITFFDRLDRQYNVHDYRNARAKAWGWIKANPLQSYQWDAQFEDVQPRGPFVNLAREQACDVAVLLLSDRARSADTVAIAEELLRFAEDQFVVWAPVKDPAGWKRVMPKRRKHAATWITPCVLEQYVCYDPVARSSAVMIDAYLEAWKITKKAEYLQKARALANGLVDGQTWLAKKFDGNGEIPTWVMREPPINWLNNSYYAADALSRVARVENNKELSGQH
jgi:hypothetical protein